MPRILIIAGDGTSSDHLDYGYYRMLEEGYDVTIAGPAKRGLKTVQHQADFSRPVHTYTFEKPGYITPAHAAFADVDPSTYDGLLLPGGRAPEFLRNDEKCVALVRHFVEKDKPISAMCHGPHLLIAAGLKGRRLTCTDDVAVDVEMFGNIYVPAKGVEGQPDHVIDGNIVSVRRRPFHYVWVREFLTLLEKRGIRKPKIKPAKARVLILGGDFMSSGQLLYAYDRMKEEGHDLTFAATEKRRIDTALDMREEIDEYAQEHIGFWMNSDAAFQDVDPSKYDGLILPGWRAAEYLRDMESCRRLVRHFLDTNKPIGAMCEGPRILAACGVKGRRMTCLPMARSEIAVKNTYVDAKGEAVIDGNIATVSQRPYYHVWMRSFLTLLYASNAKAAKVA